MGRKEKKGEKKTGNMIMSHLLRLYATANLSIIDEKKEKKGGGKGVKKQ